MPISPGTSGTSGTSVGPIEFQLNEERVVVQGVPPETTLLRWLRDHRRLTGTKEGCAEGDCGACTVAVLERGLDGASTYRSVCSCLLFLPMVHGRRVYTVEGLATGRDSHLVQQALSERLGSQCGYCTPGVVMSLFEACYRDDLDESWKLDAQMCGNLCRCTGYRPIRDAARTIGGARPADRFLAALDARAAEVESLEYRSTAVAPDTFTLPTTLDELWSALARAPHARLVAGATDLALEVTKKRCHLPALVSLEAIAELRTLETTPGGFRFGAGVRLTDLETFSRFTLPPLERMLRYFGSRQIKNRATIGGNLCTASPIGDLAPVFLALDATLVLRARGGERRVPIADFFRSYRRTALEPGEILAFVEVSRPSPGTLISSYKVSKRRELDISTVSAAFAVRLEDGRVADARLAYGGMAAVPARARRTEASLRGAAWTEASVEAAAAALAEDFVPIGDHRGSAWYRGQLAGNLLLGFFLETQRTPVPRLSSRHAGTTEVD